MRPTEYERLGVSSLPDAPAGTLVIARVVVPVLRALVWCAIACVAAGLLGADGRVIVVAGVGVFALAWTVMTVPGGVRRFDGSEEDDRRTEYINDHWREAGLVAAGDTLRPMQISPRRMVAAAEAAAYRRWSGRALRGVDGMSQTEAAELVRSMVAAGLLEWRGGQPNHPAGADLTERGRAYIARWSSPPPGR